ncbi:MAG: hypothetical protein A2X08_16865 [Bacteroidetes bacterium GWA2_32_17]|nr:MAG: hypothetical protein A2X08_16865 [Bacteroidetes bacterium GWA2_32_17]
MKKTLQIILNFVIFPAIGILLLYYAFKNVNINDLWNNIKHANFYWVGLSLIFAFLGFISRALRWVLLIEPLGYKPSKKNTILAVFIAYFANMAMPRLGEITRCGSLNKTDKIPMDKLIGTVITERVIDFITLLLFIAFVLIVKFEQVGGFFNKEIIDPLYNSYFSSYVFWIIIISALVFSFSFLFLMRQKLMGITVFQKLNTFIKGIFHGLKSVFKMRKLGLFFAHTVFIWSMYVLMTYVVFFAIEPTKNLTFIDSFFILTIGGLGMSAPVQNGFGTYHWIVSLGLMLYGISQADGLLYATICHESQTLMVLITGPIAMLLVFLAKKKLKN